MENKVTPPNREIKFRVWDGKSLIYDIEGFSNNAYCTNIRNDYWFSGELMQFTGVKDKNGKEIYENDIIEYLQYRFNTLLPTKEKKVVIWKFDRWNIYETNAGETDVEVIGNIHEND